MILSSAVVVYTALLSLSNFASAEDPRLYDRPALLNFEHNYHDAFKTIDNERRRQRNLIDLDLEDGDGNVADICTAEIPAESPLDLRITKAHAGKSTSNDHLSFIIINCDNAHLPAHGYDSVRISVITYSEQPPTFVNDKNTSLEWDYSGAFRYRWTAQFDTGIYNTRCQSTNDQGDNVLLNSTIKYTWGGYSDSPAPDSQCLFACQDNEDCNHYSFFYNSTSLACTCELFSECKRCSRIKVEEETQDSDGKIEAEVVEVALNTLYYAKQVSVEHEQVVSVRDGWTTTAKYGNSYIHTRLTKVVPGMKNIFAIDGHEFNVKIPKQGEKAKCIVWGDPCISSKFVGCSFGQYFDAYEKSVKMLNALSKVDGDNGYDCFIMLGDNFYDSDGRVSVSFWKRLSVEAMSKPIIYILGNHDIWTGGSPAKGISYDPLQYSLQYLGLDTVAGIDSSASTGSWFNYQINPDDPPAALGTKYQSIEATSSITNSISWFMFGNIGMLYFNGAYDSAELKPYFEEAACSFFGNEVDEYGTILLIGHWNGNATTQSWLTPYGGQLVTPDARSLLLTMPGCSDVGKRLIYFDGHGHINQLVEVDNGYLMGAHGVMGVSPQNFSIPIGAEYGHFFFDTYSPLQPNKSNATKLYYCQEIYSDTIPASVAEFNTSTINMERYRQLLVCLEEENSVTGCITSICEEWPYFGGTVEMKSEKVVPSDEQTQTSDGSGYASVTITIMLVLVNTLVTLAKFI